MSKSRVTKRYDLLGRNEWELVDQVETLRHAIRIQQGAVLEIHWTRDGANGHRARVLYEVPVSGGQTCGVSGDGTVARRRLVTNQG